MAQSSIFIPGFRSTSPNPPSCAPFTPTITYTATGSGPGLVAWGADDGVRETNDHYIGTDDPPTAAQITNLIKAGNGTTANQGIHTIPTTQAAVAFIYHLPAGCTLPSQPKVLNSTLSAAWAGTLGSFHSLFPQATGTCTSHITRVVRGVASGTSFLWKGYLNQINSAVWGPHNNGNVDWPNMTSTTSPLYDNSGTTPDVGTKTGGLLAQYVHDHAGTIGYVVLADATGKGFTSTPSGSGGIGWTQVQNGTQLGQAHYADPQVPTGTKPSNCQSTVYKNVPTGTDPTLASWSAVIGSNPNQSNLANYSACGLTYDVAFKSYKRAFGDTTTSASQFQTTKDLLQFETSTAAGGGQIIINKQGYATLPSSLHSIASNGAAAIAY